MQVHKDRNIKNKLEERTQGAICPGPAGNLQGTYNLFSLLSGKKITHRKFTEVPMPTIVMKQVAVMPIAKKKNEGHIFENRTGVTVNDIFPDDDANEVFNKIYGNTAGVDWEEEPPEQEIHGPEAHIPNINNNQYTALEDDEDDDEN